MTDTIKYLYDKKEMNTFSKKIYLELKIRYSHPTTREADTKI